MMNIYLLKSITNPSLLMCLIYLKLNLESLHIFVFLFSLKNNKLRSLKYFLKQKSQILTEKNFNKHKLKMHSFKF